jgi:hypothetical protein
MHDVHRSPPRKAAQSRVQSVVRACDHSKLQTVLQGVLGDHIATSRHLLLAGTATDVGVNASAVAAFCK